jgi:hypothetical protein
MQAELKPGCLAIIILSRHSTLTGPTKCSCAIGKIVTVIERNIYKGGWEVSPIKCEADGHEMRYGTSDSLRPLPDQKDVRDHDIAQIDIKENVMRLVNQIDLLEKLNGSVSK